MATDARTPARPLRITPRLRSFITAVITPFVLVAGLLTLALYHYKGALLSAQAQNTALGGGAIAYSNGPMSLRFERDSGGDRPTLTYANTPLVSYQDWSSTVSVDGVTQELWNNNHGYDVDSAHQTVYSTTSGPYWQLIAITSLVNDHTVTVSYSFVARPTADHAIPHTVEVDIAHGGAVWYGPSAATGRFTGQIIAASAADLANGAQPKPLGALSVAVSGAAQPVGVVIEHPAGAASPAGLGTWATAFTTVYHLTDPAPNMIVPLGVETITYHPGASSGATVFPPANYWRAAQPARWV